MVDFRIISSTACICKEQFDNYAMPTDNMTGIVFYYKCHEIYYTKVTNFQSSVDNYYYVVGSNLEDCLISCAIKQNDCFLWFVFLHNFYWNLIVYYVVMTMAWST
jgi:hypothetical protein